MRSASPSAEARAAPREVWRFDAFTLDVAERRLARDGEPLHLATRYFDLLVALVRRPATLVERDALFAEVWPDVVVGDAALAQGIRTLRRLLGDDATQPRFIETVTGHGYRFIAPVEQADAADDTDDDEADADDTDADGMAERDARETAAPARLPAPPEPGPPRVPRLTGRHVAGGILGALVSAMLGGVLYGAAYATTSLRPPETLVSILVLSVFVGVVGGACIFALAHAGSRWRTGGAWLGALGGGMLAGALGEGVGRSVLTVFTGLPVGDLTGALEGALIGACLGLAPALYLRRVRAPALIALTALATMGAFVLLATAGRPFFASSLVSILPPADVAAVLPLGLTPALRLLLASLEGLLYGLTTATGMLLLARTPAAPS